MAIFTRYGLSVSTRVQPTTRVLAGVLALACALVALPNANLGGFHPEQSPRYTIRPLQWHGRPEPAGTLEGRKMRPSLGKFVDLLTRPHLSCAAAH